MLHGKTQRKLPGVKVRDIDKETGSERESVGGYFCARR